MKPTLDGCAVLPALTVTTASKRRTPELNADPTKKRSNAGRFATINTFADCSLAKLSRAEIAVWLLLWRDTKPNGLARTSQADLARRAGTDPRTVRRAIARLVNQRLLTVAHRGGLRRGMSSYRVLPNTKDD